MTANKLLDIKNLSVMFKKNHNTTKILDQLNLSIDHGETLALVGGSGSGKTLTAMAILQLLPYEAMLGQHSQILFKCRDLLYCSAAQMRAVRGGGIGMIFQEASAAFNPVMTVGEQIDSALKYHTTLSGTLRKARVLELLDKTGIVDPIRSAKSYPHMLSGGMRQRAMIAMALAPEPDLLIADEPTTALDVTLQAQILDLLIDIQKKQKIGLLFITHDLAIAKQIAHRVAIISAGKIVECQSADNFFNHPKHAYSQKLFAALPSWERREDKHHTEQTKPATLLVVAGLKIYFPVRNSIFAAKIPPIKAVDDVNFSIESGQTFALVGESGSGKTTLAKGILNLIPHNAGQLYFAGQSLDKISAKHQRYLRKNIQMIFQDSATAMDPRIRVGEILFEGVMAQKIFKNKAIAEQKIDELLHYVGLSEDCKTRYPHQFSGGQRQRICIARALAMQPKLVICDEPTSALDVVTQIDILNLLKSLQEKLNIAYLLITHNISIVAYLAHQAAVMYQGKIVEQGRVEQILFDPQHDYTQKLLSSAAKGNL